MSPLSLWDAPGLNAADTPGMTQRQEQKETPCVLASYQCGKFLSQKKKKRQKEFNWIQSLFSAFPYFPLKREREGDLAKQ